MGVQGLTPFLQKNCPDVIRQLPDRLRSLSGKKIVIDGTLITQRFHFAQAPHPYRHVLGWYRLLRELNDAGVSAICVFDGKERNLAKAREAERRKEVQRILVARGSLENDRSKRLDRLANILERFHKLDATSRNRTSNILRQLSLESDAWLNGDTSSWKTPTQTTQDTVRVLASLEGACSASEINYHNQMDDLATIHYPEASDVEYSLEDENEALHSLANNESNSSPRVAVNEWGLDEDEPPPLALTQGTADIKHLLTPTPDPTIQESCSSPKQPPNLLHTNPLSVSLFPLAETEDSVPNALIYLYVEYRKSIAKLASLATSIIPSQPPTSTSAAADPDTQAEVIMTKAQLQLTLEEGNLWESLVSPSMSAHSASGSSHQSKVDALAKTSNLMLDSYQRRTNPPTLQTYDECREIIQAMGIPCVNTAGAFEAEALASSIVLNGLADYVVSEDTDVLVYEAPLIRNITNRQSPLMLVSGADVRTVLQLDRAAFIDFALLLGTDFSQRIKNVGPARAFKFIKEHGSIERVIELETNYPPRISPRDYLAQVEIARIVFRTLPPIPDQGFLEQGDMNDENVARVLQRYGLGRLLMVSDEWKYEASLDGNYFKDNPRAY